MPTVRTTCPSCEVVIVDARDITLRRHAQSLHVECSFLCPECTGPVVQSISDKMVPVLIGAGCEVEDWEVSDARSLHPSQSAHPSQTGRITETEIVEFILELERDDWMAELLEH